MTTATETELPTPNPSDPPPSVAHEPQTLSEKVARLRDLATGKNRPLGSPEGRGTSPNPTSTRSFQASIEPRRVVDGLAVGIRTSGKIASFLLGRFFPNADLVPTAEECYSIAAPLAGYMLDRVPETGPVSGVLQRAGLFGAISAGVGWFLRAVVFGQPGGEAESESLRENLEARLARQAEAEQRSDDTEVRAPVSLGSMFGAE